MPPKIIVITGPTATGKTKLGIALAKICRGEIVSADSMQIYKRMDIGTAKPTSAEMQGISHHMIDIADPFENYSVARYVGEASICIDQILSRGKQPILVGGTGLYIDSLVSGRDFAAQNDTGLRRELSARYDQEGGEILLTELSNIDPESAAKLHTNDKNRIIRAMEVYISTGKPISQHNRETKLLPPRYSICKIILTFSDRNHLYDRINLRVDDMIACGLEDEVRALLDMGLTARNTSMQAIGYKEFSDFIRGKCTRDEAIEKIKMESRRYAKRQLSWLRRDENANWIQWEKAPDFAEGLHRSTEFLEECGYNIAVDKQI